jgi:4-hydroxy-tetrahydrodipicolinate reductase
MSDIRIGVVGCTGRMGQALMRQVLETDGCVLAGGAERPDAPDVGRDLAALCGADCGGLTVLGDSARLFTHADAVLDFTSPAASADHARFAAQSRTALVIGTTGLNVDQEKAVRTASEHTAIVWAPNMSVGVTVLRQLTRQLAGLLDEDFDIEIVEMHHRHKVDAPSGTALALGEAAAQGRGRQLADVAQRGRDGITGPRERGGIGFAALRGGNVVGDHTVIFAADNERIEITHKAADRAIFARGAVRAACWAAGRAPGLYDMNDVLGFSA